MRITSATYRVMDTKCVSGGGSGRGLGEKKKFTLSSANDHQKVPWAWQAADLEHPLVQ